MQIKERRGLGIIDLKTQNTALLLKYMDKFYNHADLPWVHLTWEKCTAINKHHHRLDVLADPFGERTFLSFLITTNPYLSAYLIRVILWCFGLNHGLAILSNSGFHNCSHLLKSPKPHCTS